MSFADERAVAERLLVALGVRYSDLVDPLVKYGRETGADVEIKRRGGKKVGIQVTEFSIDEGIGDPRRNLRATEKRHARAGKIAVYPIPHGNQPAALRRRIGAKVKIAATHDFHEFSEVWLLVAAMLARPDAVASTTILPQFLSADDLNGEFDDVLRRSRYARAFIHVQVCDALYEWTPRRAWRSRWSAPAPVSREDLLRCIREPTLVGEVPPHPTRVQGECGLCGGPFTKNWPRQESARADGRYIHADPDVCARLGQITTWKTPG